MTVRLRPMTEHEFAAWLPSAFDAYITERVRLGESEKVARRRSAEQQALYFPADRPAVGHELFVLDDDGRRVGMVWVGPRPNQEDDPAQSWLFNIEIDEEQRGRGHARTALQLVEAHLALQGVRELGLNVFADNVVARRLYTGTGFREVSAVMAKTLPAPTSNSR